MTDDQLDGEAQRVEGGQNGGEQGGSNDPTTTGDTTMSDSATKFEVEIDEETTLSRDDLVEHVEYGPLVVSSVQVGPFQKTVEMWSERGPEGLKLSGDEIREQWGEKLHYDPVELYENTFRAFNEGISVDGLDVEMSISTEGDEDVAELAHVHALDEAVRAMQAIRDECDPNQTDGAGYAVDWEGVFEEDEGDA